MNREHKTNKGVENKVLKTKEDDLIQLEKNRVYFSQNDQNLLEVYDHDIVLAESLYFFRYKYFLIMF